MGNLKKQYRDLEMNVHATLRELISKSKIKSKHLDTPIITVNSFGYTELAIIDDKLTFMCNNGYHYSVFSDYTLEDLIDIVESIKK